MDKLTSKLPTLKRQQKKRVGFALGCALLCLFSMGALGSPDWTSYENKSMGFEDIKSFGLFEYTAEGDNNDDGGKIKEEIKGRKFRNFKAFEYNRFTACVAFLVSLALCLYNAVAAVFEVERFAVPIGYGSAASLLLVGVFFMSGAGYFGTRMENNPFVEKPDEVAYCDHGCALAALDGVLCVVLAAVILCDAVFRDERTFAARQKVHDVAIVKDFEKGVAKLQAGFERKVHKLRKQPDHEAPAAYATAPKAEDAAAPAAPAAEDAADLEAGGATSP